MSWNYAELSKAAKAAGGPEALTELLVKSGKNQMVPWIVVFSAVGVGIGVCLTKTVELYRNHKRAAEQKLDMAKKELIQGINEYDKVNRDMS